MINIYHYFNYRQYLLDLEEYWRENQNGFSYRKFASKAGFSSPNFFKLVCEGKRNLSPDGAKKIAKAIGLKARETEFFVKLVEANQAKTAEDKIRLSQEILKNKDFLKMHPLKPEEFEIYNQWHNIPLRESLSIAEWDQDPTQLAKKFKPHIPVEQIRKSLEQLEKLGLIQKNKEGRWSSTHETISTGDLVSNASLVAFHRQVLELAKESLDRFRGHEREVSAATVSVSKENQEKIREILREAKKEILNLATQGQKKEVVLQVNFQMFPLMKEDKR